MSWLFPLILNAGCGTSLTDLNVPFKFTTTPWVDPVVTP